MEFLKIFSQLNKSDASIAGGKGASLGEMTNAGIPVPPGFVVLSSAFEKFLEETDLDVEIDSILHTVKHDDINTVEQASEKIRALILSAKMPEDIAGMIQVAFKELGAKYVAVRSSATAEDSASAAWAGQLDSFLNTTEDNLLDKVKACWASLFTPRAIFYRFEQNLHTQKISVAVVVQKMVESEVSGIAFSVHPVTQDYNQLIIEAGFGLGEAIVSGQITPDSYVVEKQPRRIVDKNVAEQTRGIYRSSTGVGDEWRDLSAEQGGRQKLTDEQILELTEIILRIENHYGFPCDIEWARETGKFYIVQSRPITTLMKEKDNVSKLKHIVTRKYGLITSDLFISGLSNPENYKKLFFVNFFVGSGVIYDRWCFGPQIKWLGEELIKQEESETGFLDKMFLNIYQFGETLLKQSQEIKTSDWKKANDKKLIESFKKFAEQYKTFSVALAGWGLQIPIEASLRELLKDRATFDEDLAILTSPRKLNIINQEQESLLQIGVAIQKSEVQLTSFENLPDTFKKLILDHTAKFCWMTRGGLDDPWSPEDVFSRLVEIISGNCQEKIDQINQHRQLNLKKTQEILEDLNADKKIIRLIEVAKELVYYRTYRTDYLNLVMFNIRPLLTEIGRRLGKYDFLDIATFREAEILAWQPLERKEIIQRQQNFFIIAIEPNKILFTSEPKEIITLEAKYLEQEVIDSGEIKGNTAFSGKIKGRVKVVLNKRDLAKVETGDVLVSIMTTPDYIVAMEKAAAFVTNEGGITCHAAIIAREMGKPCIIGTKIATKILHDGDLVEVDAGNGVVKILSHDPFKKDAQMFRWGPVPGEYFYMSEFLFVSTAQMAERFNGLMWPKAVLLFDGSGRMLWLNDLEQIERDGSEVFMRLINNDDEHNRLYSEYLEKLKDLEKIYQEINQGDLSKLSDEEFGNLWNRFYQIVNACWLPTVPAELGNYGSPHLLEERLKESIKDSGELASAMEILTAPEKMSFYQQEEIELLKTKDVVAHTEEYSWLKNSYAGVKKLPVSFFEDRKKELDSELENKEAVRIDLVKKKKLEVKEKYQISDEVIHIARSLSRAVEWQDDRKEFIFRNLAYKDLLLHEVARRTKNDHADLLHFGYQEIAQMLSDDNYEEQIRSRRHGFGFIIEKTTDVVDSEESRRLWNLYGQEDVAEDVKEFGGIVASKGDGKIVRGRVRVLFRPHQGYFEKGEILVAPMTSPEYVFAMKQSAAIVTDAGGLTSHAAIVSRELGKPCIVGSKIATQVLHDGDLVEVDANNGVVRKL